MARLTVGSGINEYIAELEKISVVSPHIMGMSVYEGAKIVTDEIHREIASLPESEVSQAQKEGLLNGLGIAHMRKNLTGADVKVGMDGYNSVITKKHPNGQPNMMIARSLISGTSFHRKKNDFVRRAVSRVKGAAEQAMKETFDRELKKYVK